MREVSGLHYDTKRRKLAPTEKLIDADADEFVIEGGLLQIGDGMSGHTPGAEGAIISGERAAKKIRSMNKM